MSRLLAALAALQLLALGLLSLEIFRLQAQIEALAEISRAEVHLAAECGAGFMAQPGGSRSESLGADTVRQIVRQELDEAQANLLFEMSGLHAGQQPCGEELPPEPPPHRYPLVDPNIPSDGMNNDGKARR
jgi:hypothetical protein